MPEILQSSIFSASGLAKTRISLLGATLGSFAYGIAACLYISILGLQIWGKGVQITASTQDNARNKRQSLLLTSYTTVMFVLVSVSVYTNNYFLWTLFPAGPGLPFDDSLVVDYGVGSIGTFASVIDNWMGDALLIWRVYTLLHADGRVLQIGATGTLATFLIGAICVSSYQLSDVDQISTVSTSVGMLLTLSVNLFGGGIICIRLMMYRNRMVHLLGKTHGTLYTNIAMIVLESAVLFVIVEAFFFITFLLENPLFNLASEVIGPLQSICSFLVIYRVMQGRSVSPAAVSTVISKEIEFV